MHILKSKNILLFLLAALSFSLGSCSKDTVMDAPSNTGKGGSLARFTIVGKYLYIVNHHDLVVYDINQSDTHIFLSKTEIGMDIETIYPFKNKLFIGSKDAMYIYSISDPAHPILEARADHVRSCDPVVANDRYAYVTLRTNTFCDGDLNALLVYDIEDVFNTKKVFETELKHPFGLGLGNEALYVCDDDAGLKVFDLVQADSPALSKTITDYTFKDCIPHEDVLVCMLENGMAIYDISDALNPVFVIKVN